MEVTDSQKLLVDEYMAEEIELTDAQSEELVACGFLKKVQSDTYYGYAMTEEGMQFILNEKL
jgi:hypothetical protein